MSPVLEESGLWRDLSELPETVAATLDATVGFSDVAARHASDQVDGDLRRRRRERREGFRKLAHVAEPAIGFLLEFSVAPFTAEGE